MNTKLLVGAALAVGVVAILTRKSGSPSSSAPTAKTPEKKLEVPAVAADGYTKTVEGNAIFTRPNGVTTAPLAIVYGGIMSASWARKEGMESMTPADLKKRVFMLFVDIGSGTPDQYEGKGRELAKKYGLTITDVQLLGFSGGAQDVQKNWNTKYSFIGLIDPSTGPKYLNLPFTARTRMIYNVPNWGTKYTAIRDALPKIAAAINAKGGKAESINVRHEAMVPKFFSMYSAEMSTPKGTV